MKFDNIRSQIYISVLGCVCSSRAPEHTRDVTGGNAEASVDRQDVLWYCGSALDDSRTPKLRYIVEVWRTGSAQQWYFDFKAKICDIFDFSKTVAKMLFLSVSHESIGILTISRKKVFRSTPPSRGDRLILRSKIVENHENQWFHWISKGNHYDSLWKIP